jgi:transposase
MSRLLKRLGLSHQKARPQHPQSSPAAQAAFNKEPMRAGDGSTA